jgi:hypothetical protein
MSAELTQLPGLRSRVTWMTRVFAPLAFSASALLPKVWITRPNNPWLCRHGCVHLFLLGWLDGAGVDHRVVLRCLFLRRGHLAPGFEHVYNFHYFSNQANSVKFCHERPPTGQRSGVNHRSTRYAGYPLKALFGLVHQRLSALGTPA